MRQPTYQTRAYESHHETSAFIAGIIITLLVIAIILGVLLLLKKNKENTADKPGLSEVIQGRYARGEINKEEYESLKSDLLSPEVKPTKSNKKDS